MNLTALAQAVERADPDRFAATMAAPVAARAVLWPLYAFNLEVARAAYASDQPLVAEMRLQWWADEIARMQAGAAGQGDVAQSLAGVLRAAPGLAPPLLALIEARRWDCWTDPFDGPAAFDLYLDQTAGSLAWAAAQVLGAPPGAERVVRDFAWGAGLANWLDAVPALMARGRWPLPDPSPAGIRALAARGLDRIAQARARAGDLPGAAHPALWPGWSARRRLTAARRAPERVLAGHLPDPRALRALSLGLRRLTGYW